MLQQVTTRLSVIAIVLGLSACASTPRGEYPSVQPSFQGNTARVSMGSVIDVPSTDESLAGKQARVLEQYHSASGRQCLRVEIQSNVPTQRVMCERDNGEWSMTRSLFNSDVPADEDKLLIKTPLSANEVESVKQIEPVSTAQNLSAPAPSTVADSVGLDFDVHYSHLSSFDGNQVWDYAGTSTAGPKKWAATSLASLAELPLSDSVAPETIETPITGRR